MESGWDSSAQAWIADMGEAGDFSRTWVLDAPMLARVRAAAPARALDVGCGEGRFCRMMAAEGVAATGIDPTEALLVEARGRDGTQTYIRAKAEALPLADGEFDLVVSYLSLIDIADLAAAYAEMLRVLRPGGRLLIANLSSFATALPEGAQGEGWLREADAAPGTGFACDRYHEPRGYWIGWRGIRVRNYHRPMQQYMTPLLAAGMVLTHFEEPAPPPDTRAKGIYCRAPMFVVMEWRKPAV